MADISKRGASDDCEGGERGKRGKRGKRGHRGHQGPPGSSTTLLGPTTGPGSLIAAEDIPAGFVIAAGGSARLALADGSSRGNVIGVSTGSFSALEIVEWALSGVLVLAGVVWDAVTGGSGGLVEGNAYYLSQTTPGHLTNIRPTTGQIVHVGTAVGATALNVQLDGFQIGPEPGPAFTTWALKWSMTQQPPGFGPSSLSDDATGVGVRIGSTDFKFGREYAFTSPHKAGSVALRTQTGSESGSGTIRLKKNGAVFASFPTPSAGSTSLHPLGEQFLGGDNIEVVLESLAILSITVVVEFQEPAAIGPTGAAGPIGAPGPTGFTGAAGPQGPTGAMGTPAPWLPINKVTNPTLGGSFAVLAGFFNLLDASVSADGNASLPAANSVPNGTPLAIGNYPGLNGGSQVIINLQLQPGDSLNGQTTSPTTAYQLNNTSAWLLLVSDGVSNWQPLSYASLIIP